MSHSFHTYRQLLGIFWQTAIAAELEYRLNFVLASFTSLANLGGSIFSLFLFYRTGYHFARCLILKIREKRGIKEIFV